MTSLQTPNLFVFSAASEAARVHYQHTMVEGVHFDDVSDYITNPELSATLREAYPEGTTYCWEGRSGGQDEHFWGRMNPGDLVMCYRERRILSYAYGVAKVRSAERGARQVLLARPDGAPV